MDEIILDRTSVEIASTPSNTVGTSELIEAIKNSSGITEVKSIKDLNPEVVTSEITDLKTKIKLMPTRGLSDEQKKAKKQLKDEITARETMLGSFTTDVEVSLVKDTDPIKYSNLARNIGVSTGDMTKMSKVQIATEKNRLLALASKHYEGMASSLTEFYMTFSKSIDNLPMMKGYSDIIANAKTKEDLRSAFKGILIEMGFRDDEYSKYLNNPYTKLLMIITAPAVVVYIGNKGSKFASAALSVQVAPTAEKKVQ